MSYIGQMSIKAFTQSLDLARSLILLLLSTLKRNKNSMLKAILAPLEDAIGKIC